MQTQNELVLDEECEQTHINNLETLTKLRSRRRHSISVSHQSSEARQIWSPITADLDIDGITQNTQTIANDEADEDKMKKINITLDYNKNVRIIGLILIIMITVAFAPSVYRFLERGKWVSNPLVGTNIHPSQTILSSHTVFAILWGILCTTQVVVGTFMIKHDQTWFGRKYHIFMGRYVLSVIILIMNITALIILFNVKDRANKVSIFLNVEACFFIIFWSCLGYYFIFKKKYLKHKDCMIAVMIATFSPGITRMTRYVFQMIHYAKYGDFCKDVNVFPYIMITSIVFFILSYIALRKRLQLKEFHNLLFMFGPLFTMIVLFCTMEHNLDPCANVNTSDAEFGLIIG